jgi:microsomal dipeptidase-like Zn-dependent dipeptidase/lysophospholipase L1-like esterase
VLEMTGYPAFDLRGQGGFQGGPGQDGGDGGDGSTGRAELYDFFGWCRSGPGNGGNGGPGGAAGAGGQGGNGGHGGRLSLYAPQPVISAYSNRFYVTIDGGNQGPGGIPGTPGQGGAGGQVGASPKNCAPSTPRYAGIPGPQGASGTQGPAGQQGGSHPDGIAFLTIDADDFRRKLTEPAITTLSPDRVKQGDTVSAAGLRFTQTDRVLVENVPVSTTVVSDSMLTFQVPSVQGGYRAVQVEQTDGTRSNRGTLYVLPVVTSAQQGNRVKPGTTVTLVGSGFAPGAVVRVNGQDMPNVSFIDPTRISFTLVRPSSVVENPAGEQVSVTVVLTDGTPSNEITLVLDTFRMLVLGDSVQWGQGLQEGQKFHSLVQAAVKSRQGNVRVYKTVLAHSGATIGVNDSTSLPAIDGEVPTSYPTIMQQCDTAVSSPRTVDLVLVDGGINDLNVRTILDPTASTADIRASTERLCHTDMVTVLKKVTSKFKNADVVVTGYFPIITQDTDINMVETLLIAAGVVLTGPAGGWAASQIKQALVANCRAFDAQATTSLQAAVAETNDWLISPTGGGEARPRIFFANPLFTTRNAVFAPDPWLWGINGDSTPQDNLVAGSRWTACNLNRTRTDLEICKRASIGHPNARGAQEYAKAITEALSGEAPPALVNGDFETGQLQPWVAQGTAFANQPASADRPDRRVHVDAPAPSQMPLGGDYWQGGYDIHGPQGKWWISTDDAAAGTLTSNAFKISASWPWFSCLVGGGNDPANLRVEFLILATEANRSRFVSGTTTYRTVKFANRDHYVIFEASGQGSEQMRRVAVNVGEYDGEQARIRIVDRSTGGHINADNFRFSTEQPVQSPLVEQRASSTPLWGFADLHTHPLSHLGFGGKLFWGKPDGPIEQALAWCDSAHGPGGVGWGGSVGNVLMSFFEGGPGHLVGGYPQFDGWPRFTTRVHQQMYVDWIRRAYQGGLRLMVALVVNNALLASEFGGQNYDDRTVVETQIQGFKDFVGLHSDFMEIAYAPADARRIIQQNKLAVILGVEVDSLGNWRHEGDAQDDEVRAYLGHLYRDLGVRHIFPIHLANNAFGGTAVYNDTFDVLNRYLRDDYYEVHDASDSAVQFRLGEDEGAVEGWYRASGWYAPPDYARIPGGHANVLGLTRQGAMVVEEMMRLGMLIDVDHMSQQSVSDTLGIAEHHGYPLVAGHTGFRELAWRRGETAQVHKCPNEYHRTRDELARIRELGGMVAVGLHQGDLREWGRQVRNDAAGSSKSWAQAYLYAIEQMGGGRSGDRYRHERPPRIGSAPLRALCLLRSG